MSSTVLAPCFTFVIDHVFVMSKRWMMESAMSVEDETSLSLELGSLCFWRFIALSILSFMIWLDGSFNPLLLCLPFYLILLLGGAITTATFTLMMTTSQRASQACVQTLTHTTMATAEVLGKVIFTALAGLLVDHTGYVAGFIIFANLSMLALLPIYKITIFAPKGTVPS
eukprot:XP_011682271.1 PREDICTED: major facilitator superfamily domain-containing protein 3-like [Strongylocentrotus purpuratus]